MSPEQLEGYLRRLDLRFTHQGEEGPDGVFLLGFTTRRYRSLLPPHKKSVKIILSIRNEGDFLTLIAPFLYRAGEATDRTALYECLLDINYTIQGTHFEVDRRDGEVRCATSVPIKDSNLSISAFEKLVYAVPAIVDHYDTRIRRCLQNKASDTIRSIRPAEADTGAAALLEATSRLAKVIELLAGQRTGRKPAADEQGHEHPRLGENGGDGFDSEE
jgi:hypothetical protein